MIRKAIFWTVFAQATAFAILFFGSVIIARLLSPREMGIYAASLATAGILQIIASFGIANYVIRSPELEAGTLDTAFTVNAVLGIALGASIFTLGPVGAHFLGEPGIAPVMHLLALSPIISIFEFRSSAMLQREMKFKCISLVTTAQVLATTGVTIGTALGGASFLSPAFGTLASSIVGMLGYTLLGRRHFSVRLSGIDWRPMTAFGLRMMLIGGIAAVPARLGEIVLGHLQGVAALGLFSRASNLSLQIFLNIYQSATRVLFVRMSEAYRETGALKDLYLQGLRFITAIMGPILLGMAVLSRPIIHLLYGDRWLGAAMPLTFLAIAQLLSLRYAMNWELFVIRDESRVQTRIEIAKTVFSLVSRTIGSLFSVAAAAAATIADALFSTSVLRNQIDRLIDAERSEVAAVTHEAVPLAAVAVTPSFALMAATDWDASTPLPFLAAAVALGTALWIGALALHKHPLFDELLRAARLVSHRLAPRTVRSGSGD